MPPLHGSPPAVARPGCRTRHHPAHYHLCGDAGVLDVAFPEAVALAAIRTDLDLRRDIALGWDYRPLCRRISASIGEQRYQAWAYHNAPIRRWIRVHRARFEQLRNGTWRKPPAPQILTPSKTRHRPGHHRGPRRRNFWVSGCRFGGD